MQHELSGSTGLVTVTVTDKEGKVKHKHKIKNLITDAGDQYHVRRIGAGIGPAAPAQPTLATGMKLGTGATAVAKNGPGAALVTYLAGSQRVFDAAFVTTETLGAGLGWTVTYQCTWVAGVATSAALTEVALVTDAAVDATTAVGNTFARVVFPATPKGATDTLAIAWAHKQLGS